MQPIIDFFGTISPAYRTAILATGLVGFWALEGAIPLFSLKYSKIKHALLNLFFILTTLVVNLVFAFFIIKACDFTTVNKFGLLYFANLPLWLHVMLGVLLLDFIGAYLIHWIQHKVKWMWKFHDSPHGHQS